MIGCWCEETFVEKIDRARGSLTRSQFCREAIAGKLKALGYEVPDSEIAHPDRAGKGGPKRAIYRIPASKAELNEVSPSPAPSSRRSSKKS